MQAKDYGVLTFEEQKRFIKAVCFFCVPDSRRLILVTPNFYVISGLGPVTEGYVILAPRAHLISFVDLPEGLTAEASRITELVVAMQRRLFSEPVLFEHGKMGCTFDPARDYKHCFHAHLNFIPLRGSDLLLANEPFVAWEPAPGAYPWGGERRLQDHYLWVRYRDAASVSAWVSRLATPQQYLRQLVARAVGASQWNWQDHPNTEQVLNEAPRWRRELSQTDLPDGFSVYDP